MNDSNMAPAWQVSRWFNTDQDLNLEQLRGKVVVLHAFQMLCPGCVSHGIPQAERLHRLLQGEEAVIIGLHTVFEHHAAMTPVSLEAFLHEYRITHPVGVDMPQDNNRIPATMQAYDLQGTPSLVVIDHVGRIRHQSFGRADDLAVGLLVGRLLDEKSDLYQESAQQPGDAKSGNCNEESCSR